MRYDIRFYPANEVRVEEDEQGPTIHCSLKFNTLSLTMGYFTKFKEKVGETAFDAAINNERKEVLAFWNHQSSMPLGRRSRQTLEIERTKTLFKARIRPGDTTWGQDAVKSVKRGDVEGMSFGFRQFPEGCKWEEDDDRNLICTLTNVDLIEVSPTPIPAYPSSSCSVRSEDGTIQQLTEEELEEFLAQRRAELHGDNGAGADVTELVARQVADRQRRERLQRQLIRR